MAAIQNERDKILQAAPVRFIPPPLPPEIQDAVDAANEAVDSVKGIEILSDGTVFKVTGDVTTPSTITFAINFRLIAGTVTWSVVQGTATLTGAGNTRFLAAANMSTDRVRIRASITVEGVTYTDEIDITKVYDGADGKDGKDGEPGPPGKDGAPGPSGTDGDAVDIIFRRAPTQPATPSPSSGTPSGWYSDVSQVPSINAPMWSSVGTKPGSATNYTWQTPVKVEGSDGETGLSVVELTIYRRATSTPATPSGGTFNFTTQTLTPPSGWSWSVPSGTDPVYMSKAVASIQGTTGTVSVTGWTTPILTIRNGEDGAPGSPGIRGTVQVSASRSPATWSDAAANSAILSYTGSSTRVAGDQVTLYNTTAGWAETRYWTGSVWQFQTQVIDGNLIVTGTLEFGKLRGGEATFSNFSGTISVGHGNSGIGIYRTTPGNYNQSAMNIVDYHNGVADVWPLNITAFRRSRGLRVAATPPSGNWGYDSPVAYFGSTGSGGTVAVTMSVQSARSGTTTILAQNTGASTQLDIATGAYAAYAASGTYGPFTGSHEGAIDPSDLADRGDIVVDAELLHSDSLIDTFHRVEMSSSANQSGVVGVVIRRGPFGAHVPAAYQWPNHEHDPAFDDVKANYEMVVLAAVGEGQINVCGQNGNISKGDLIICSDIPGKGMRQDDNIVRSHTVAKARADVTFSSPEEIKLVPCIYLCG